MRGLSGSVNALVAALVVYVVADFFLTPLGGLETRPVSGVTPTGFVTLGLIFAGLVLAVISVVLLFRGSRHSGITAAIAAVLYLPAPFIDATGIFSKFPAPIGDLGARMDPGVRRGGHDRTCDAGVRRTTRERPGGMNPTHRGIQDAMRVSLLVSGTQMAITASAQ